MPTMDAERFRQYLIKTKTERGKYRRLKTVDLHIELLQRLYKSGPSLTVPEIERFLLSLYEKGRKGNYLNSFIDTIRMYGRFLQTDIYDKLAYYPEEEFQQATMSDEEIQAFLDLPPPITKRHYKSGKVSEIIFDEKGYYRWTLFFKILAFTGMRPGEVAHLTVDRVDVGRAVFVLNPVDTKTNSFRHVPIPPSVLGDVTEHMKSLSGNYLFPAAKGISKRQQAAVVDDVDWGYNFHQRLKRLGIKRHNLRPSSLRPSFITRMLEQDNVNVFQVQKIVGHRRISTTEHYTHLTTKDIIKTIKQDPLGRKHLSKTERLLQGRKALEDLGYIVTTADIVDGTFLFKAIDE